ncbi:hypothetical protein [Aliikangiella maris]|uniref:Lipoprotein n=2 Tax=Aliikangiella maris TaxID=3162458 RepID=A0ABV2BR77_9GAMM
MKSFKTTLSLCTILCLTSLLLACANKVAEQYEESFFTYADKNNQKLFSLVLKIKGSDQFTVKHHTSIHRTPGSSRGRRIEQTDEPILIPENPDDARVSLKYRMEEAAHKMLNEKLTAINYCTNGISISEEKFHEYEYKIKGQCKE